MVTATSKIPSHLLAYPFHPILSLGLALNKLISLISINILVVNADFFLVFIISAIFLEDSYTLKSKNVLHIDTSLLGISHIFNDLFFIYNFYFFRGYNKINS